MAFLTISILSILRNKNVHLEISNPQC